MLRQLALFFNLTTIFLGTGSALPSQPLHVKVVPGSVKSGTFEVGKGAGKVPVEARERPYFAEVRPFRGAVAPATEHRQV
jgi:hypothetical protein